MQRAYNELLLLGTLSKFAASQDAGSSRNSQARSWIWFLKRKITTMSLKTMGEK